MVKTEYTDRTQLDPTDSINRKSQHSTLIRHHAYESMTIGNKRNRGYDVGKNSTPFGCQENNKIENIILNVLLLSCLPLKMKRLNH